MKRLLLTQSIGFASLAVCSGLKDGSAIAACSFDLMADPAGGWQQILPVGAFRAKDGRPADANQWVLTEELAETVIQRFQQRTNDAVVDYEHQTLHAENNGAAAPAAGWMKELEWREGVGLFARVEWTAKARQMIRDGEYRYLSPVFRYAPGTGEVLTVEMAAVTNYPGLDGMQALAAMRSKANHPEDNPVDLAALIALLGMNASASEEEVLAALKQHLERLSQQDESIAAMRAGLGLSDGAGLDEIKTGLAALKAGGEQKPDPTRYVGVEVVEQLRGEIAALTGRIHDDEVEELVTTALDDGRLLPAQEPWARDLGKSNVAALRGYLQTAQPIAALRKTQTNGKTQVENDTGLSDDELAVCTSMGIDPGEYAKNKPGYKSEAGK